MAAELWPMLPCAFKTFTGHECPGCGIQRAFQALLQGNLQESIQLYPPLIPMLLLLLFTAFHLRFRFAGGHRIILWGYIGVMVCIAIRYLWKQWM
ncbi:MAG: DUF2752 domain-containing protein [Flavobacteriales bacterium]